VGEADAVVEDVFAEGAFAADAEAGAAEADAGAAEADAGVAESEADVDAEAGARRPSSPRAKADDPKNTNSMAATATLTSLPQTRAQNVCSSKLNNS
jgi:hypothetical protein